MSPFVLCSNPRDPTKQPIFTNKAIIEDILLNRAKKSNKFRSELMGVFRKKDGVFCF